MMVGLWNDLRSLIMPISGYSDYLWQLNEEHDDWYAKNYCTW